MPAPKPEALKKLTAAEVALPSFAPVAEAGADSTVFDFTSHRRAREALEFALGIEDLGYNVFVLGEERSGRMTATLRYLEQAMQTRPAPSDWVILNNFRHPHQPLPFHLPVGTGRHFRSRMEALVGEVTEALKRAFTGEDYQRQVRSRQEKLQEEINARLEEVQKRARAAGLEIVRTETGLTVMVPPPEDKDGDGKPDTDPQPPSPETEATAKRLLEELAEINRWAGQRQMELVGWIRELNQRIADHAIAGPVDSVLTEFGQIPQLGRWLTEMRADMTEQLGAFQMAMEGESKPGVMPPAQRYAVNLFVDHGTETHPKVVLESNPTYENLFGRIEYRQAAGSLETDFTLIRPGALHQANDGGVLVVRAEALARDPAAWTFLKGALRDRSIQIEERYRAGSVPIAGAPRPEPIPLDLKLVIVGSPFWYYSVFSGDPEFQAYVKVKADIDPDMEATAGNIACYTGLLRDMMRQFDGVTLSPDAVDRLLGEAAREAGHRRKLTARFELIDDILVEAVRQLPAVRRKGAVLGHEAVEAAIAARHRRNARVEDRLQEAVTDGTVMIDVRGRVVGQINALVVRDLGDHAFGMPARVSARASAGREGVTNIERDVDLGGPIQQKGVMVLQGFLAGSFARDIPLSFTCSITFEQSYGGVEGDSASMAELIAILSDLADIPVRQDLAITGSVNQHGKTQAIGGAHHKVEGFFRTCVENGGLTGDQGVVLPRSNEQNLVLDPAVTAAIAEGRFHLWSVDSIEEAAELFLDTGWDEIRGRVETRLRAFNGVLTEARHKGI
ncbi:Lon protease family protein [Oceanibaculum indicum]|uniref:endopeptidase La n=1 Tax=Oceanibaculum indicum TaxID=526216 RepID=A0A420WAJ8_9PROT|nr:ATP-binding protein [Oceanibaculum indicum]RKQ68027.1 putative ATP-dependent protease [Oceanibaculum indicum]